MATQFKTINVTAGGSARVTSNSNDLLYLERLMKNCDTCIYFIKVNQWRDGRKGLCDCTDYNIKNMKGKPCKYYKPKKYKRKI